MRKYFLVFFTLIILLGCASTGEIENPPAYTIIKPGTKLQLNKSLTIPPDLARVYFQYGEVVSKLSVNQYYPSCTLLSYVVSNNQQIIQPDIFEVLRVRKSTQLVQAKTILLASSNIRRLDLMDREDGPMAEIFTTIMDLSSVKNPDIKRLECLEWRKPIFGKHLSITEIRQALGEIIEIKIPEVSRQ